MDELLTPDGVDELITAAQAAQHCGVTPEAIRLWVHRGKLTPAGRDARGRNLFRLLDVARCEHSTRKAARR